MEHFATWALPLPAWCCRSCRSSTWQIPPLVVSWISISQLPFCCQAAAGWTWALYSDEYSAGSADQMQKPFQEDSAQTSFCRFPQAAASWTWACTRGSSQRAPRRRQRRNSSRAGFAILSQRWALLTSSPPISAGRCQLDMGLYSEEYSAGAQEPVYPINAVRNRALQMVQTKVSSTVLRIHVAEQLLPSRGRGSGARPVLSPRLRRMCCC